MIIELWFIFEIFVQELAVLLSNCSYRNGQFAKYKLVLSAFLLLYFPVSHFHISTFQFKHGFCPFGFAKQFTCIFLLIICGGHFEKKLWLIEWILSRWESLFVGPHRRRRFVWCALYTFVCESRNANVVMCIFWLIE